MLHDRYLRDLGLTLPRWSDNRCVWMNPATIRMVSIKEYEFYVPPARFRAARLGQFAGLLS